MELYLKIYILFTLLSSWVSLRLLYKQRRVLLETIVELEEDTKKKITELQEDKKIQTKTILRMAIEAEE